MNVTLTDMIKQLFKEQKKIHLTDLYQSLSTQPLMKQLVDNGTLQHRIRSCLYSLKKNGFINRIDKSTYQINE